MYARLIAFFCYQSSVCICAKRTGAAARESPRRDRHGRLTLPAFHACGSACPFSYMLWSPEIKLFHHLLYRQHLMFSINAHVPMRARKGLLSCRACGCASPFCAYVWSMSYQRNTGYQWYIRIPSLHAFCLTSLGTAVSAGGSPLSSAHTAGFDRCVFV